MKLLLSSILLVLISCSTQTEQNSDFDARAQTTEVPPTLVDKEVSQPIIQKDSIAATEAVMTEESLDPCASRKDTTISNEIIALISKEYPDYRIARNTDFFEGYWCHFYAENQSPYFVTGDFDGDEEIESVLMINKEERYTTLIILIDKTGGELKAHTIEERKIRTDINMELKFTKYGYGLKTKAPFKFKNISTDSTYDIQTEIIVIEGFEEKADYFYYYENGEYKELMLGG